MNKIIADHIDELLYDSGLFPSKVKSEKKIYSFDFSNEIILITGAAGSIGSELSRQLINCKYKKLILLDVAESPLYELIKEFEFENFSNVKFILLNITDEEALHHLFEKYKPSIIFHTAAYKHVPLMEQNAYEALKLNVLGTKLLADLSIKHSTEKFVFISTDKAVNPISVMGITKKIGENYLNYLNTKNRTFFITTRFGNILGSNGSVVPLFKKQIESGHPITITDKTICRYFISKHKACMLILKLASKQSYNHNLFTFNMGEPISVIDIIERLVLLYDKLEEYPEIKITGLRPGEKLHEEIISNNEVLIPTDEEDILIVKQKSTTEIKKIDFSKLLTVTPKMANHEIKAILKLYV